MDDTILGIGAAIVDSIAHVDDTFLELSKLTKGSISCMERDKLAALLEKAGGATLVSPGGSCANVIRGLAGLEWPCTLMGKTGNDAASLWLQEELQKRGIVAHYLYGTQDTAQVVCLVTPDGERTMCDYLGASAEMDDTDLTPELFTHKRLVHIDGYTLLNGGLTLCAMMLAQEAGAAVSFDLANFKVVEAYRSSLEMLLRQYVTIIFANGQEASCLLGTSPAVACRQLAQWCPYAVVTVGAEGCYVCHGDTLDHIPAHPIAQLVDTTGAGDLFATGFLNGWLCGHSPALCAIQGALLAATVIQQEGATIPITAWLRLKRQLEELDR